MYKVDIIGKYKRFGYVYYEADDMLKAVIADWLPDPDETVSSCSHITDYKNFLSNFEISFFKSSFLGQKDKPCFYVELYADYKRTEYVEAESISEVDKMVNPEWLEESESLIFDYPTYEPVTRWIKDIDIYFTKEGEDGSTKTQV